MAADSLLELRAAERTMIVVRWIAVVFALVQVETYYLPYPPGVHAVALAVVAALALGAAIVTVLHRRARTLAGVRRLAAGAFALDFAAIFAFVAVYTFDVNTAMFVIVYLLPLEGAIRYQRRGALGVMALAALAYTVREWWGSVEYGHPFLPASISFRMGVGFLIAAVAGQMAWRSMRERRHVEAILAHERKAAEALRAMDELKNTFLSAVSHELRTPLTAIMGFAITLRDRYADRASQQELQMLDHLVAESTRLDELLDDLLDLDRLTRGKVTLRPRPTDVADLATTVANNVAARMGRHIATTAQPGCIVDGDQRMLERVVENLLNNAIKYAPADSPIQLTVAPDDGGVLVRVDDEGPGVPAHMRHAIFEPFRRGRDELLHHSPGTGIGLSLVQRFVDLHGGRVWVEQHEPSGASFRVFLPAAGPPPPP